MDTTATFIPPPQRRNNLPSIKDLFPALGTAPNRTTSSAFPQMNNTTSSNVALSPGSTPSDTYNNAGVVSPFSGKNSASNNYTLTSDNGSSTYYVPTAVQTQQMQLQQQQQQQQQSQPQSQTHSQPQQTIALAPVSNMNSESQVQELASLTNQISAKIAASQDMSLVSRQLLIDGYAKLQQLGYIYQEWSKMKDMEDTKVASRNHKKTFQSMEEQAVRALTSMNETHNSTSSSVSSPSSILSSPTKVSSPSALSPVSNIVSLSSSFKRRKSVPSTTFRNGSIYGRTMRSNSLYSEGKAKILCKSPRSPTFSQLSSPYSTSAASSPGSSSSAPFVPSECMHCRSRDTPEWRRGPTGERTLCNACGLFYAKLCRKYGEKKAKNVMEDRKTRGMEMDRRVSITSAPTIIP